MSDSIYMSALLLMVGVPVSVVSYLLMVSAALLVVKPKPDTIMASLICSILGILGGGIGILAAYLIAYIQ